MKIAVCASNKVGYELSNFMLSQNYPIEFVLTKQSDEKIIKSVKDSGVDCYTDFSANCEEFKTLLLEKSIDIVFLLWWPDIIKSDVLDKVKIGFVNLHPSYLPYNRGMHPYYWSVVDETPSGVSIHFITDSVDDGSVICQEKIDTDITMTGDRLYELSLSTIVSLFKNNYDCIVGGDYDLIEQDNNLATFHLAKELDSHSEIVLDKEYKAIELLNIIRARSFRGNPSSFFYLNGKKYYVNIEISEVS